MGMVQQILPPGVEDGEKSDLGAEMLGIASDGEQSFGRRTEQNAVDGSLVLQSQRRELFGQRKHDMEILHRKQFRLPLLEPLGTVQRLTLRTVAIAAGVVGDTFLLALIALFDVAAQRSRAAKFNGPQGTQMLQRQAVRLLIGWTVAANNVGQL